MHCSKDQKAENNYSCSFSCEENYVISCTLDAEHCQANFAVNLGFYFWKMPNQTKNLQGVSTCLYLPLPESFTLFAERALFSWSDAASSFYSLFFLLPLKTGTSVGRKFPPRLSRQWKNALYGRPIEVLRKYSKISSPNQVKHPSVLSVLWYVVWLFLSGRVAQLYWSITLWLVLVLKTRGLNLKKAKTKIYYKFACGWRLFD